MKTRKKARIGTNTVLQRNIKPGGQINIRNETGKLNEAQRHIRTRAGAWDEEISGVELLKRTRP